MINIPNTMNAFVLEGHGDLDRLVWHTDWPTPTPSEQEVLIKVSACGLNNTDVNTRSGWYSKSVAGATTGNSYASANSTDSTWGGSPITFPRIQGADVVGVVVAVGKQVSTTLIGKRVITDNWLRDWNDPLNFDKTGYFGSEKNGGFAEYTCIDHRNVGIINSELSDAELATFSCSYTTAEGMLTRALVTGNDTVLVTGASGGVGSALIQLAKHRDATVIAMASESKHDSLLALGADAVLPRHPPNLQQALQAAISQPEVTVVADVVGGNRFASLIEVLCRGGRYTCSGAIAGPVVNLDLRTLYLKDLTFTGSTVLPPNIFKNLVHYIENGVLQPLVAASYPLAELHEAQEHFIQKQHTGNIVVTMS